MKTVKLTERAELLLAAIAAGKRVFYFYAKPVGWSLVERAGLAVRRDGDTVADLTDAGRALLAARPEIEAAYRAACK